MKEFSLYIFMLGGRLLYETLYVNLPLPSPTSVGRYLHDNGPTIVEGEIRCGPLKKYLEDRNLPMVVWISEDATRITGRLQYDSGTNQVVGLVLPLNENGIPKSYSFIASSAGTIEKHVKNNTVAPLAYAIMAQPLSLDVEPFCLQLYGTDNKFDFSDVIKRQNIIKQSLAKEGIIVLGISTDGDPKLLKAMKIRSKLGIPSDKFTKFRWFHSLQETCFYIQDIIHIGTKLRNRLLNPSIELPLGKFLISASHLQYLIKHVSKDKHSLTATDIDPKDRQNFGSIEKILQSNVRSLLEENVPDSDGTVLFLTVCDCILTSFRDTALKPLDRVYKIWYSTFILRGWRLFVQKSKNYTLGKNFITANAYTCIELNAHSIVEVMVYLREINKPEWFIPILMSSQPCEEFFRKIRSFSPTYSTQVNCSMLEIMQRIKKIQLQGEIIHSNKHNIKFPRLDSNLNDFTVFELPQDSEICNEIEKARKDAIKSLKTVQIEITAKEMNDCGVTADQDDDLFGEEEDRNDIGECVSGDNQDRIDEEVLQDLNSISSITGELFLRDYSEGKDNLHLSKNIAFTVVEDSTGKKKIVRKSTILWLLVSNPTRLSSDRLVRVKLSDLTNRAITRVQENNLQVDGSSYQFFRRQSEISIGEWCLFHTENELVVALVLGFKLMNGKSVRDTKYAKQYALIDNKFSSIGVLATWHILTKDSTNQCKFYPISDTKNIRTRSKSISVSTKEPSFHAFLSINNYIGTVSTPSFCNGTINLNEFEMSHFLEITSYLTKDIDMAAPKEKTIRKRTHGKIEIKNKVDLRNTLSKKKGFPPKNVCKTKVVVESNVDSNVRRKHKSTTKIATKRRKK